jgi:23S rRNA G2069 N7-methylase RlmK/C1962 C5-methylase RlmI
MLKELSKMKNNQLAKNLLICGDNLRALDDLKKRGIAVDLIYLDPSSVISTMK